MAETDPSWEAAGRAGLASTRRDADMMARAANANIGPLLGVWVERNPAVQNGKVTVQVTAQYEMLIKR